MGSSRFTCWASEWTGMTAGSMMWKTATGNSGWVRASYLIGIVAPQALKDWPHCHQPCWWSIKAYTFALCISDLWAEENRRVHLPHSLLCQYRGGAVGRLGHLQDQEEFCVPAGDEVSNEGHIKGSGSKTGSGDFSALCKKSSIWHMWAKFLESLAFGANLRSKLEFSSCFHLASLCVNYI